MQKKPSALNNPWSLSEEARDSVKTQSGKSYDTSVSAPMEKRLAFHKGLQALHVMTGKAFSLSKLHRCITSSGTSEVGQWLPRSTSRITEDDLIEVASLLGLTVDEIIHSVRLPEVRLSQVCLCAKKLQYNN